MNFTVRVWRQPSASAPGRMASYAVQQVSPEMSFLEMLDLLNEQLVSKGEEPVAFDHDCREGICGSCGMMINGRPHGPGALTTTCQLYMRAFRDGEVLHLEPWRASAFPVLRDLVVDRSALDRVIQAGGYVSVSTGNAVDANSIPVPKPSADAAMDAAQCIGCGACVAACPNASASLFTSAKIAHLALLPQGQPERQHRALAMVKQMRDELFGHCSNAGECEASCPKGIKLTNISFMNREYLQAAWHARDWKPEEEPAL